MKKNQMAVDLKALFGKYEWLTLRKVATVHELNYVKMLNASKAPIEGEVYNSTATNWTAIVLVIGDKMETVLGYDWDALGNKQERAIVVKDTSAFQVGTVVYIRRSDKPYTIVYRSESHVVLVEEGSTEPRSWAWETFMANGPSFKSRQVNN